MTTETEIIAKLDSLAEFTAKRDLIEMDKRAMLDEVKIPDEILAIQDEASKKAQAVFRGQQQLVASLAAKCDEELEAIQIPDEIKAALAEIDRKRALINAYRRAKELEYQSNATERRAQIDAETQAQTAEVFAALARRKQEIEAEFSGKAAIADKNIEALKAEIKQDTIQYGATVKGKFFQSVWTRAITKWKTEKLDDVYSTLYVIAKDDPRAESALNTMDDARKVGEVSVQIRTVGTK